MLHYWPYASITLAVVGLCFIVWGAVLWNRQQSRTDNREIAEVAKIEAEREKTYQETLVLLRNHQESPEAAELIREEKEQAADPTVEDDAPSTAEVVETGEPTPSSENSSTVAAPTRPTPSSLGKLTQKAVQDIRHVLKSTYGEELDIVPEVRIGGTHVDAAVTSRNPKIPNLLVDVRVIRPQRTSIRMRVDESIAWSARARRAAKTEFKQFFLPVVFFVIDTDGEFGQQTLFPAERAMPSSLAVSRVWQALEELAEIEIPLLLIVGTLDDITPEKLTKIRWKANTPRVLDLGALATSEPTPAL